MILTVRRVKYFGGVYACPLICRFSFLSALIIPIDCLVCWKIRLLEFGHHHLVVKPPLPPPNLLKLSELSFFCSCPFASSPNNQSDLLKIKLVLLVSFLILQWAHFYVKNKIQIPYCSLTESMSVILIPGSVLVSPGRLKLLNTGEPGWLSR